MVVQVEQEVFDEEEEDEDDDEEDVDFDEDDEGMSLQIQANYIVLNLMYCGLLHSFIDYYILF